MPTYQYTARDERGSAVTGTLSAPTPDALADLLRQRGYLVTGSREVAERSSRPARSGWLSRIREDDVVVCNIQLAKMIHAGLPLVTALRSLSEQRDGDRLRDVLRDVTDRVEGGAGFSEALRQHPRVFSTLFVSLVRAGEVSGKLDDILRRLAFLAKRRAEVRQQLQTALTYPALLIAVGLAVMAFLVTSLVPKFMAIFVEAGVALPWPTRMLYDLSQLARHGGGWVLLGLGASAAGAGWALRAERVRLARDRLVLRLPVIGRLARLASLASMCRTLETLFASGVPVLESLTIAEQTCNNAVIADACRAVHANVARGGTLSDPLQRHPEIPPMVPQMIAAGESSGTVDQMWGELAEHFEELLQHGLKRALALVEPACLLVMGAMVAFIMASLLLPIFKMVNVVR